MIEKERLEQYCIKEINKIGRAVREDQYHIGRMHAFSEVLKIIAEETYYESIQEYCCNGHDSIKKVLKN